MDRLTVRITTATVLATCCACSSSAPVDDAASRGGSRGTLARAAFSTIGQNEVVKLVPADTHAGDMFGGAIALGEDILVVGQGRRLFYCEMDCSAHVFQKRGAGWVELPPLRSPDIEGGDGFGEAVAITVDRIAIGAPLARGNVPRTGAVYVFVWDSDRFTFEQKIMASGGVEDDRFGASIFLESTPPVLQGRYAHAITPTELVVGAPGNQGRAYVFSGVDGVLVEVQQLVPNDPTTALQGANFASAVSGMGDRVVVGAPGYDGARGAAYFFQLGVNAPPPMKLFDPSWAADDEHGYAVTLAGIILLGAPGAMGTGSLDVFIPGEPKRQTAIASATALHGDGFGASVAAGQDHIVVGRLASSAPAQVANGFTFSNETWNESHVLSPRDGAPSSHFGAAVSLFGNIVAIGAPSAEQPGSVYLFDLAATQVDGGGGVDGGRVDGGIDGGPEAGSEAPPPLNAVSPYSCAMFRDRAGGNAVWSWVFVLALAIARRVRQRARSVMRCAELRVLASVCAAIIETECGQHPRPGTRWVFSSPRPSMKKRTSFSPIR